MAAANSSPRPGPLAGVRVLELGHNIMGPACGLILADLGAEVWKVERPGRGDDTRHLSGFGAGFFTCFNRNKRSLAIDLKHDRGRELFLDLVARADVVIENFAPGTVDRLGIGWEQCRARNPRIVFCALKGFMPGPYAHRQALDEVVQMLGGLAWMTGPSGRPLRAGASVTDILSGSLAAVGILAALREREHSGVGQLVQASLFESVALLMGQHMAGAALGGEPTRPMPERARTWAVYELFTTVDNRQVFIGLTSDRHWQRFCQTFGFADWADDPQLATNRGRLEAAWLLPEVRARLGRLDAAALVGLAERAAIPFAPVNRPEDLWEDPHLAASGGLVDTATPAGDRVRLPGLPLRLGGRSFPLRLQPPAVGEGTAELLRSAGMTDEAIEGLAAAGIVSLHPGRPVEEGRD